MVARVGLPPNSQWFDLPLIGDDLAKVGRAIDIYAAPCQPTAEIWVYGFFAAIPTLFISVAKPELVDFNIVRHRGRPKKGKRLRFYAQAIFRDAIFEIPAPRWVVFRIYEWGQRIGWYFLVADALTDFSLNWLTMAYVYAGCQGTPIKYAVGRAPHSLQGSAGSPAARALIWNGVAASGIGTTATTHQLVTPGKYRTSWNVKYEPYVVPSQAEIPYVTRLSVNSVYQTVGETAYGAGGSGGSSGSAIIDHDSGLTNVNIWCAYINPNKFCYVTGDWSTVRLFGNDLLPDP